MKRHKACPLSPQKVDWSHVAPKPRNTKDCQHPPEARREKYDSSPETPEGTALLELWFGTSGLKNCERINFHWFKPLNCSHLYGSPRKLIQTVRIAAFFTEAGGKENRKEQKVEKHGPCSWVKIMFPGTWHDPISAAYNKSWTPGLGLILTNSLSTVQFASEQLTSGQVPQLTGLTGFCWWELLSDLYRQSSWNTCLQHQRALSQPLGRQASKK